MSKTIVITGGSSGIGKACAELYGKNGYNVVFTGRDEKKIESVASSLREQNIDCLGIAVDAASEQGAKMVIEKALQKFGSIDVLICNAGISMRALFEDLAIDVFKKVMDVNFMGTVYYVKFALPHLLKSKGTIIGMSSINGRRGTPARTAYSSSKHAMEGFFEALRAEVMNRGVHVLVVCPGYTGTNIRNTALTADGKAQGESPRDESKMMSAEKVASYIFAGQKKKKRDIVLTPLGIWLIRLNKIVPALMDKIVIRVLAKESDSPLK